MMKTNYLTAVVLGLLAALSGCQAEDDTPHTPQGNIPVGFSGDVPGTRATKEYESAADLTDIGVFAYFTNGAFSEGSSTPNFMYNQQVERQTGDGSWTYSPVKYWPGNTMDKISFFAYGFISEVSGNIRGRSGIGRQQSLFSGQDGNRFPETDLHRSHSRSRPDRPSCRHAADEPYSTFHR